MNQTNLENGRYEHNVRHPERELELKGFRGSRRANNKQGEPASPWIELQKAQNKMPLLSKKGNAETKALSLKTEERTNWGHKTQLWKRQQFIYKL